MMRFGSAKTLGALALAAVWIAPLDAFGQPRWGWQQQLEQQLERNRQQGSDIEERSWNDPHALVRRLTPEITDVDAIGDSVPTSRRSAPFRLRAAWTEDAAIVNRMSELGSPRDGFCIKWSEALLTDTIIGNRSDGRPIYAVLRDRRVWEECHGSADRFKEFEVPGNANNVSVRVRVRFGLLFSKWSAESRSGVLAE